MGPKTVRKHLHCSLWQQTTPRFRRGLGRARNEVTNVKTPEAEQLGWLSWGLCPRNQSQAQRPTIGNQGYASFWPKGL